MQPRSAEHRSGVGVDQARRQGVAGEQGGLLDGGFAGRAELPVVWGQVSCWFRAARSRATAWGASVESQVSPPVASMIRQPLM